MKRTLKAIGTIGTMLILLVGAYWLGTTQAETITEIKVVEKVVEVVPDGYIPLEECIPLADIAYYFIDEHNYPCFELRDTMYQLDNPSNRSYDDIMNDLEYITW